MTNFFSTVLNAALAHSDPHDPAQGLVAVRSAGQTYYGRVDSISHTGSGFTLTCHDREGRPAPYPVHIAIHTVQSMRFADLIEAPDDNHHKTNGPV